jgi:Tol biopolymer transport system component
MLRSLSSLRLGVRRALLGVGIAAVAGPAASPAGAQSQPPLLPAVTELLSVSSTGELATKSSFTTSLSSHAELVAFDSEAYNLAGVDGNLQSDLFLRNRRSDTTTRVSVNSSERPANDQSLAPDISADGGRIAFVSSATNLVDDDNDGKYDDDTNGTWDVFVRDRSTGTTVRVSVSSSEKEANDSGNPQTPSINADGRYVVFRSTASNLVSGDTNGVSDVFVRDLKLGITRRVSLGQGGVQADGASGGGSISGDGRVVAFTSQASNLVAGDTNDQTPGQVGGGEDVFVRRLWLAKSTTQRVSVRTGGAQAEEGGPEQAEISGDGRWVAFSSAAGDLVAEDLNDSLGNKTDIFLHHLDTRTTRLVSVSSNGTQANLTSNAPAISADGREVAFSSEASNLVPGDTNDPPPGEVGSGRDVFRHDTVTGRTRRFSVGALGEQLDFQADGSSSPSISAGGRSIAFSSDALDPELGPNALLYRDIFIHEPAPPLAICCGP